MGSQVGTSSLLELLPTRPPTPPRETAHETEAFPKQVTVRSTCNPLQSLQTPPNVNTPSPLGGTNQSSGKARKRVGFSAQAEYQEPPVFTNGTGAGIQSTPVSVPPSSSKPTKSILKVTSSPHSLDSNAALDGNRAARINIATMLESTVQQLAGSDRESKLDAYMMLIRALKASNNLPDRVALEGKMGLFMQFIQRDVTAKTEVGAQDSTLLNQALNLLSTFLYFPGIASTITTDFGIFIIDHCIRLFEDATVPKDVVRHLMQVVALQNFPPKVMTSDRVGRLVTALHNIEEHIKGKSIVMSRVLIYRKLVKQCKQLMILHTDWLLDLFTDILSNFKEIRVSAISLGLDAAFVMAREKPLSRRVMEIFQLSLEEKKYIDFYADQLRAKTKDKVEVQSVPQIWSVIVLFLRAPDKWDSFGTWLHIIQTCFNSGDYKTKQEANHAWSRLIFSLHYDDRAFLKSISTLSQPLASQLRRKGSGKHSEELRRVVLGVIRNLFYYAFRPTANLALLDGYWDHSVKPLMQQLLDRKLDDADDNYAQATAILAGLFDCSTPRLWVEDHIIENPFVKPEELPAIDAKWIRKNAARIFEIVELIMQKNFLELCDSQSKTHNLWQSLVGSVASAAAKEIKVSLETAGFIAQAFGVLARTWNKGLRELEGSSATFLASMREFILVMVESLGLLPFTEKQLSMNNSNDFTVSTPAHRPGKIQGVCRSPLYHLFSILSTLPPGVNDDDLFAEFINFVFAPFFGAKGERARVALAQELLHLLPVDIPFPYGSWLLISGKVCPGLEISSGVHLATESELLVGHEYRDIVRILERGLRSTPNLPWHHWKYLFLALCGRVKTETGDAGLAIGVIEPLSNSILQAPTQTAIATNTVAACTELIAMAVHPRDRQALDAARRRLWGTTMSGPKSASSDPYDHLYKMIDEMLVKLYDSYSQCTMSGPAASMLHEVSKFLGRTSRQHVSKVLLTIKTGIARWIQDRDAVIHSPESPAVSEATISLWDKICSFLLDRHDPLQLENLEPLLCAGFSSKHLHIVNTTATIWNQTFKSIDDVMYPKKLEAILLSLRPYINIILPGLDRPEVQSEAQRPQFIDSQIDMDSPIPLSGPFKISSRPSSRHSTSPGALSSPASDKRRLNTTPTSSGRTSRARRSKTTPINKTTTPRFRHDDSQIQFALVNSSPHGNNSDSYPLTERQNEVREWQKENAALFPEIRSSSGNKATRASSVIPSSLPADPIRTPDHDRPPDSRNNYQDFITSTPTPRRGQPLTIPENDVEMSDPPSSPPEPRRYPLLPEIKPRSSSNSLLDEWQFSSSPVAGSPNPLHHRPSVQASSFTGFEKNREDAKVGEDQDDDEEFDLQEEHLGGKAIRSAAMSPQAKNEVIQLSESSISSKQPSVKPSTPSRVLRSMAHEASSDIDVFVDAPSSPIAPSPRFAARGPTPDNMGELSQGLGIQAKDRSFEISDGDERSMLRLVVELDAKTPSPEKQDTIASPVLDCITVIAGPEHESGRGPRGSIEESPLAAAPATSPAETAAYTDKSHEKKKKRKRSSKAHSESARRKKRKLQSTSLKSDEVSDSQAAPANKDHEFSVHNTPQRPTDSPDSLLEMSPSEFSSDALCSSPEGTEPMNIVSEDMELESQLAMESAEAAKRGDSQCSSFGVTNEAVTKSMATAVKVSDNEQHDLAVEEEGPEGSRREERVGVIMRSLQDQVDSLRSLELSRSEVYKIEDMLMDMKRELFEAERRGRR